MSTVLPQLNVDVHKGQEATIPPLLKLPRIGPDMARRSASGTVDDSEGGTKAPRLSCRGTGGTSDWEVTEVKVALPQTS